MIVNVGINYVLIFGHFGFPELGHLSADAIAANSVATTFYQYLKVVVIALSATSSVMIEKTIGEGKMDRVRFDARTLAVIDVGIGALWAFLLFILRTPLLSVYNLNGNALQLAGQLRNYSRWRRSEVYGVDEYYQCLGDCNAALIFECICLALDGCGCGNRDTIRPDF